jgi:hypothetical protein
LSGQVNLFSFLSVLRKGYESVFAKPEDYNCYWVADLPILRKAKTFLSPAVLEGAGLTGKDKFQNVPAWSWNLFLPGSSLRTLRALREKIIFPFLSLPEQGSIEKKE